MRVLSIILWLIPVSSIGNPSRYRILPHKWGFPDILGQKSLFAKDNPMV